ncbi:hypothetical protein [Algibacter lectus]|nr:hypothetical protein [Algibacter lectus]
MQGNENREIFKVKSPSSEAFRHGMIPKNIEEAPLLTTVVRQYGEAWNRPFVAIYEPSTTSEPSTIKQVDTFGSPSNKSFVGGLKIESLQDRTDIVFSSDVIGKYAFQNINFNGTLGW